MADFELLQATMSQARLGGHSTVPRSFSPAPYNNRSPWNSPGTDNSGGRKLFAREVHLDLR